MSNCTCTGPCACTQGYAHYIGGPHGYWGAIPYSGYASTCPADTGNSATLTALQTQVDQNTTNISTNVTNIGDNTTNITNNSADITALQNQVAINTQAIANFAPSSVLFNPTIWVDTVNGSNQNSGLGGAADAVADIPTAAAITQNNAILGTVTVHYRGSGQQLRVSPNTWNIPYRLIFRGDPANRANSIIDFGLADFQDGVAVAGNFFVEIYDVQLRGNYNGTTGAFASAIAVNAANVRFLTEIDFIGTIDRRGELVLANSGGIGFDGQAGNAQSGSLNFYISGQMRNLFRAIAQSEISFRNTKFRFHQDAEMRSGRDENAAFSAEQGSLIEFTAPTNAAHPTSFNAGGETGQILGQAYHARDSGSIVRRSPNILVWNLFNIATLPGSVTLLGLYRDEVNSVELLGNVIGIQPGVPTANQTTITNTDTNTYVVDS